MGHWGWRPLLLAVVISVWVTGCTLTADPIPPSATSALPTPQVTLTVGRVGPPVASPAAISSSPPTATPSPTPGATATPTATPPPVTYTVQAGDTLLDIAIRSGVELAALRAANADADLSLLQIGQVLIIPPPSDIPAPGTSAAPVLAPMLALIVAPPDCYETRAGGVICLGRIDNPTDQAAERVTIDVRLLQSDGGLAAQEAAAIEQTLIPPQGFAPYRAQFNVPWALYQSLSLQAQAALLSADAALQPEARYAIPAVRDASGQPADGRFIVTAALVNGSSAPLTSIRAVVTLLAADGRVVGYRVVTYAERTIAPGEALDLRVEIIPAAPLPIADYRIYVEARVV